MVRAYDDAPAVLAAASPNADSGVLDQRDLVEALPVWAADLHLRLVRERHLVEGVDGVRVLGVAVRVVRAEDEVVVAEPLQVVDGGGFLGLDAEEALALEVLRRLHRQVAALVPARPL